MPRYVIIKTAIIAPQYDTQYIECSAVHTVSCSLTASAGRSEEVRMLVD